MYHPPPSGDYRTKSPGTISFLYTDFRLQIRPDWCVIGPASPAIGLGVGTDHESRRAGVANEFKTSKMKQSANGQGRKAPQVGCIFGP